MSVSRYVYRLMTDDAQSFFDHAIKFFLWLMSLLYGAVAKLRRYAYKARLLPSFRSPKPVISVGNITLGGVGKTPLVIAIVQALQARNIRAAVLIRGFMPKDALFSDEALMLKESLQGVPIITGANRRQAIEDCLKHHAVDVFVCDDAFGHLQLQRDLNILAINASNPFGNAQVIPRGILREPLSALKDADMVVLTKTDAPHVDLDGIQQRLKALIPSVMVAASAHVPKACVEIFDKAHVDLEHFKGISVVGFCGLGDTNAFKHSLNTAGFHVINVFGFMDHHVYSEADMMMVRKYALDHQVQMIVTSHKDAVKLAGFKNIWDGFKVYYLKVDLEITHGKNFFLERIMSVIRH